jgi:hypothetical protein
MISKMPVGWDVLLRRYNERGCREAVISAWSCFARRFTRLRALYNLHSLYSVILVFIIME